MKSSSSNIENKKIIGEFQQILTPLADTNRAITMRAYLKDQFPFLGIAAPIRRKASMPLIRTVKVKDAAQLIALAEQLWQLDHREYQYAAIDLLMRHHRQLSGAHVPALLALVQSKSWWDSVDGLVSVTGDVLKIHLNAKPQVQKQMDAALEHPDFWVRRVALLHQLGWRDATDTERLLRYALTLAHEKEFFIRKAIGWALRDYARHDTDCVRQFLLVHQEQLSGLSYREAGKHIL
jgi:3-methyladenine DNA glycosylase AlkD